MRNLHYTENHERLDDAQAMIILSMFTAMMMGRPQFRGPSNRAFSQEASLVLLRNRDMTSWWSPEIRELLREWGI